MKVKASDMLPCGVLLVDKPAGVTSHDVVARVRRLTGVKKVGHGGTLDPFATGMLLLLIGKATRLFDLLAPLEKVYRVIVQFGATSTTGDTDGEITPVARDAPPVTAAALTEILPRFTGRINQRPHRYSAVKIGGEPLYKKARRGEAVEAAEREVTISRLELTAFDAAAQTAEFEVACSKGTYIRSLVEDMAVALGTGAFADALRRSAVGDFTTAAATKLSDLPPEQAKQLLRDENPSFISCYGALYFLPVRQVDENEARQVQTGRALSGEADGPVRVADGERLLAVYGPGEPGYLKPTLVLS